MSRTLEVFRCRMDFYGLPLLREQEYLPAALLEEFRSDTAVQMQRIQVSITSLVVGMDNASTILACKRARTSFD